ncbi:heavy metal-binding protein HIP-like [Oreochromis aureus]|uniref:C1q domain-containing protein n=1 Tax=Oreochromis aureus TaxID=47969 RepID=A0AAZ1Y673_OREAU|nr:heavy metal-binding protein HIP-like [Oreochromis aureus]
MNMRTFMALLMVLLLCHLCRAQINSSDNDSSDETDLADTQRPSIEGSEDDLVLQTDIWVELLALRDLVVEQSVELRYLKDRVTVLDSLVEDLQKENTVMEARMTAAEILVEELQMKNDAQARDLAIAQQNISSIQETLTVCELHVEEVEKQQEAQARELAAAHLELSAIRETLTVNELRVEMLEKQREVVKVAFSASLLASGEGNIEYGSEFATLIFRNVFTNTGNHYNPNTGYFTAPVRGVYYFRFTGHMAYSEKYMRMRLVKNSNAMVFIGDCKTPSTDPEDNASNGVVLQLEVGDVVSVQLSDSVWDDQYHRTTFSGFLLFPS